MRKRIKLLITAAGAAALLATGTSQTLPPEPTAADIALVKRTHFSVVVGVERGNVDRDDEIRFTRNLSDSGLFEEVAPLASVPGAALVARLTRGSSGCATIPILTLLSFGVVPTKCDEDWGQDFRLFRRGDAANGFDVAGRYRGPTTLGLKAVFLNMTPSGTWRRPDETRRYALVIAIEIARAGDWIRRMLAATPSIR